MNGRILKNELTNWIELGELMNTVEEKIKEVPVNPPFAAKGAQRLATSRHQQVKGLEGNNQWVFAASHYVVRLHITLRTKRHELDMSQNSSKGKRKHSEPTTTPEAATTTTATTTTTTTAATTRVAQINYVKYITIGSVFFVILVLLLAVCLYFIHKKRNHQRKDLETSQRAKTKEEENSGRPLNGFEYAKVTKQGNQVQGVDVQTAHTLIPEGLEKQETNAANIPSVVYSTLDFELSTNVTHQSRLCDVGGNRWTQMDNGENYEQKTPRLAWNSAPWDHEAAAQTVAAPCHRIICKVPSERSSLL
ncbi:uncharacterized protein [Narcine bancroftii]|uniref:uncharacterized protein n=1 Tax=Narcine bancroftii TaxID=1343680 RepID=UPI00383178AA